MALPTKLPDITPAQIAAVIGWAVAQAVAYGLIDGAQAQHYLSGGATVVAFGWKIADAVIRNGRAKVAAAAVASKPPA